MTDHDRLRFRTALEECAAAYGKTISPPQLQAYWTGLEDLPADLVCAALETAKRHSRFLPVVAVIRTTASTLQARRGSGHDGTMHPPDYSRPDCEVCADCHDTGWRYVARDTGEPIPWAVLPTRDCPPHAVRACACRAQNPVYRWKRAQERPIAAREGRHDG